MFVHETMSVALEEEKNTLLRYRGYGAGEEEDGDAVQQVLHQLLWQQQKKKKKKI